MDYDNLQQNMNTRVVFKEPRGMIRWLQLFFTIIAFSTVADFYTTVGIDITCPTPPTTAQPSTASTITPATNVSANPVTPSSAAPSTTAPLPAQPVVQQKQQFHSEFAVSYPFDFGQQLTGNGCPGHNYTYKHPTSLNGSPQFFVMTGVLSLIYASISLVIYLFFSSTYESIPVWPVADLIVTGILCLFWFIASSSFGSGVSLLKSTITYSSLEQVLCPEPFKSVGGQCIVAGEPSWKSLDVGLVSGFTSFFLWGVGMWFVYKETHFHTPRDTFGR